MNLFIVSGLAIIFGILFGKLMNRFKVPAVAGYIIAGLLLGTSGFNIVTAEVIDKLSFISDFALGIIAFNIGSELNLSVIKQLGKSIFVIAFCEAFGAFLLVGSVTYFITKDISVALILGAVSSATAPAATVMVLKEYNAKGPLTSTLLGVVAIDDAICLMIYAIASSIAKVFINHESLTLYKVLVNPLMEIFLSVLVGGILGIVLALLIKISKRSTELLPFIVGSLLLMVGIATKYHLSPLLSCMSLGIMLTNITANSRRAFESIEDFAPPIVAIFFTLAGARLNLSLIPSIGYLGVAYLVFRMVGKIGGACLGGILSNASNVVKKYIGYGLLSQVGVAVGLAIVVSREFDGSPLGSLVITILLATTIITEIIGPLATKNAIIKAKEANI
ncbi:cation:proton antiporter [Anaeromicrobium sediminis]|uniref:Potassium transporter n=1 Tax=Anaeromicrobium sediminis TaxID=1478221 RepID=A0A267MI90_9FIRM|nr:cation:proton antiporter [Anaeromicrobium sediminis]PAB58648.1 potassium transporter [Anaeromicrobium sediminis]